MGSRVGKGHCGCCVAGIDIQRSEKINMIFVTMVSIFARFCSVMEICITMMMVMPSYFTIGQGFIKMMVDMMVVVMMVVMVNLLLNRTRLHQVSSA